jgi:hypothetical protein
MSRASSNRKPRESERDPDLILERSLQHWMSAKPDLMDSGLQRLLTEMHDFARQIQLRGFVSALKKLGGDIPGSSKTIDLMELMAEGLCRDLEADGKSVKRKSLQETFYFCTGIAPDLLVPEFGKRLETFLALSGSKGLIRMFLSLYLSNLILIDLHDSMHASSAQELRRRVEAIERICQDASAAAVRSIKDWSQFEGSLTSILLGNLKAEMEKMLSAGVSLRHGA